MGTQYHMTASSLITFLHQLSTLICLVSIYRAVSICKLPLSIFLLVPQTPSPVTSLAYSEDGKLFAVGHQNGVLQLFEGRQGCVSPL